MKITKAEINNFRALKSISISLSNLSILLGENDAGKTSVLHAVDKFFLGKKLTDDRDWFKQSTDEPISVALTFEGIPLGDIHGLSRPDGSIVVRKVFEFEKPPETKAVLANRASEDRAITSTSPSGSPASTISPISAPMMAVAIGER